MIEAGFELPAVQFNTTDWTSAMAVVCPDNVTVVGGTSGSIT